MAQPKHAPRPFASKVSLCGEGVPDPLEIDCKDCILLLILPRLCPPGVLRSRLNDCAPCMAALKSLTDLIT